MVSVCLPSDALLQYLPSYLGFSYLGRGVSPHRCSSKAQPLLLTLDKGYLLTAALPDLHRGIVPLGLPVPAQPRRGSWSSRPPPLTSDLGSSSRPSPLTSDLGSSSRPSPLTSDLGSSSRPPPLTSDLGSSSRPLPLTSDLGSSSRPPPVTSDLGSSSRLFLRRRSLAVSAAAPDLGCGVAPLDRALVRRSQPPTLLAKSLSL